MNRNDPQDAGRDDVDFAAFQQRMVGLLRDAGMAREGHYTRETLMRHALRRLRRLGYTAPELYLQRLEQDPGELRALARDVLAPQSLLFRDPEIYAAISRCLPQLLRESPHAQLWVPACGTGEEVFALAMLAHQAHESLGGDRLPTYRIAGTDTDQLALDSARARHFALIEVERVPESLRSRYLQRQGQEWRVSDDLAAQCLFLEHDLLAEPPFQEVDFICYRNQLSALDLHAQRRVQENLHASLRAGGHLLVGHADVALIHPDLFNPNPLASGCYSPVERRTPDQPFSGRRNTILPEVLESGGIYRELFDRVSLALALVDVDLQVLDVNAAFVRLTGLGGRLIEGHSLLDVIDSPQHQALREAAQALKPQTQFTLDVSLRTTQGPMAGHVAGHAVADNCLFVELLPQSSEEALHQRMQIRRSRVQVAMELLSEGFLITDARGVIIEFNKVAERLTGWSRGEAMNQPHDRVFRLIGPGGTQVRSPIWTSLRENRTVERASSSEFLLGRNGRRLNISMRCAPVPGLDGLPGAILVFEDTTQHSLLAEELAYRSDHDMLTGLLNRDELERRLSAALSAAQQNGVQHLFAYLDLDQFKVINDTLGHTAGDELLREIAALLRARLRPQDALARLGGAEFGVLLSGCEPEQGRRMIEDLLEGVRSFRFSWDARQHAVTLSIGAVRVDASVSSVGRVLSDADAACFAAKDAGRDRVHYVSASTELSRRQGEMSMITRIGHALDRNLFVLHYEDVVRTGAPGEVVYRELLVRMRSEETGRLILPGQFIPAAERYYMMTALDRWVVNTALTALASRPADGILYAVNVSGLSLGDEKFLAYVISRFDALGVAPEQVCFEITETAAISHLTEARRFIERLVNIGCRFALDDFGAGMASFSYLKNLPVSFLKIDGSFIRSMMHSRADYGMVEAINRIGHEMGLKTIAEHVEDLALLEPLHGMGVDWAQGRAVGLGAPLEALLRRS
jgi:diguanylate cyclase (GGDEF)-like protein/PAS domain S-box-containing protein